MGVLARVKSVLGIGQGTEGGWRGPFMGRGENGGWYPFDILGDGWQQNIGIPGGGSVATVQGCISGYTNAFALMPASHRQVAEGGGSTPITTSALSRWLRRPNGFQTPAEFWSMGIRRLFDTGNALAVHARNDRNEITASVWATHFSPQMIEGELFYYVTFSGFHNAQPDGIVPARDVMHLRINTDVSRPFDGRSPLVWCAGSMSSNSRLTAFLDAFIANRASPSYVLTTDLQLKNDQVRQLRTLWEEQSTSIASGGTPILSSGLKPHPLGVAPGDSLLVSTFNMTVEDIARAFGMPKALVGIAETASNAEQLMRTWVSLGLGSVIEMVEQAIEYSFRLPATEEVEFDANALMRLDAQSMMTMVKEGVTGGVLSPDEGRAMIGFAPIPGGFGKMPTQQQQQIPLDLLHDLHAATIDNKTNPPAIAAPAANDDEEDEEPPEPAEKAIVVDADVARALVRSMLIEKRAA